MSLLQDAANFENRRWQNRLKGWRQDSAIQYLRRVGLILGGLSLLFLLADGARRDLSHGVATVVGFQPGAFIKTARGTMVPCFLGQSFSTNDTLVTDAGSTLTVAFTDGSVLQLPNQSQVTLRQSDAFRNGRSFRYFMLTQGGAVLFAPNGLETGFSLPAAPLQSRLGSFQFDPKLGAVVSASSSALSRYAIKPSTLVGLERLLWLPGDFVLSQLGISGRGTLTSNDSQRRADCKKLARHLQALFKTQPPRMGNLSLEAISLDPEDLTLANNSVQGLLVEIVQGGPEYIARVTTRDALGTRFRITPHQIEEDKIK